MYNRKLRHVYESVTGLMPKGYVRQISYFLRYSNEKGTVSESIGKTLIISFVIAILVNVAAYLFNIFWLFGLAAGIGIIVSSQFLVFMRLYFIVDRRKSKIEKVLPDALQMISSNLQAGMTPFNAIRASTKKDLGPLADEFEIATNKAFGTKNFSKELLKIGDRVDSNSLRRALRLIATSLTSGGHLALLLEELSEDIAENQSLKKEMITNTKTYAMFIMFTVLFGAPLLLAISINFVRMIQNMQASTAISTDEFGIGFLVGAIEITPSFLTDMSIVILCITSLLSTMLMGVVTSGSMKNGLKYSPFMMGGTVIVFYIAKIVIGNFFAGMT